MRFAWWILCKIREGIGRFFFSFPVVAPMRMDDHAGFNANNRDVVAATLHQVPADKVF